MVVISIRTLGGDTFVRGFNRFADRMQNLTEPFEEIAQDYSEIAVRNFAAQGSPEAWVPLSPKYAAWKEKLRPGRPILQFDGTLFASLRGVADGSGPDTVRLIYPKRAEIGTMVPYAIHHQFGAPRAKLPRRSPEQITESDKQRWGRIIHEWAVKGLDWIQSTRSRM